MRLVGSNEEVRVPINWIKDINLANLLTYGICYQRAKVYKIFCSDNIKDAPDFGAPLLNRLNIGQSACYEAKIVQYFAEGMCNHEPTKK